MKTANKTKQEEIKEALQAFDEGHFKKFDALLSVGAVSWRDVIEKVFINGRTPYKKTPLASEISLVPFVSSLMKNGWDAKRPLSNGRLPIFQALSNGHTNVVQHFINQSISVSNLDLDGHSLLYNAVSKFKFFTYLNESDELIKNLLAKGAKFSSEEEEQDAFKIMLTNNMYKILKMFQNDYSLFNPNIKIGLSKKCYAPTLFWGAIRYGFIKNTQDLELWILSGADATIVDGHKKGVIHALLESIIQSKKHGVHLGFNLGSNQASISPEWSQLSGLGPVLIELGKMGARWTKKKKLGKTAFEELEEFVLLYDLDKEKQYPNLEKVFGNDVAYIIRAQSTKEKLQGLPKADEEEEERESRKPLRSNRRL